jgi:hypothetical protein
VETVIDCKDDYVRNVGVQAAVLNMMITHAQRVFEPIPLPVSPKVFARSPRIGTVSGLRCGKAHLDELYEMCCSASECGHNTAVNTVRPTAIAPFNKYA